jgi:hypothetical protein
MTRPCPCACDRRRRRETHALFFPHLRMVLGPCSSPFLLAPMPFTSKCIVFFPQLRMVMVSLLFSSPPLSRAFCSSRGASIVVVLSFLPAAADGLRSSLSASQLCTMSHPLRDPRFFPQLRMMLLLLSARTDTTVAHVESSCFLQLRCSFPLVPVRTQGRDRVL